jgi:hypothetical protein
MTLKMHKGSCHCGAVKFEVEVDTSRGSRCNCSICTKTAIASSIAKPDALRVTEGEEHLASYAWGAKVGTRYFCKHCGIHCFGRGELEALGGAYVSVNLNALDDVDVGADVEIGYWDGRHNNWYAGLRKQPWPIFTGQPTEWTAPILNKPNADKPAA